MIDRTRAQDEIIKAIKESSICVCHFSASSGCNSSPSAEPNHTTSEVIATQAIRKSSVLINTPQI